MQGDSEHVRNREQLASQTGISSELIHKGLGAFFSFLKKELGEETFTEVESSVPGAAHALKTFETAPEATQGSGGLLGMVTDLAGKFLGGKTGAGAELLASFSKLGFKPEQIESFPAQGARVDQDVSFAGAHPEDPGQLCRHSPR